MMIEFCEDTVLFSRCCSCDSLGIGATIFYNSYSMQRQKKTELAIAQLNIKLNQEDQNDKYQLSDLLCQILAYPTLEEAQLHHKANHLGNFDLLSEQGRLLELLNSKNTNELKLCGCCGNLVNQNEIPFDRSLSQIKLGIGVRLYFLNLLYYIALFACAFFVYSLYALITNLNASKQMLENTQLVCDKDNCSTANLGTGAKLASYSDFKTELAVQSVLGFIYVLLWAAITIKQYHQNRLLEQELKKDWLSASEFTLMLSNYPGHLLNPKNSEETLKNVREKFKDYQLQIKSRISFEVVKVSIGYPLYGWTESHAQKLVQCQAEIAAKRDIFKDMVRQRQKSQYFDLSYESRNQEYEQFYQLITNQEYQKSNCLPELEENNTIFVTFRYSRARQLIARANREKQYCEEKGSNTFPMEEVKIQDAPEPDEIKWQNIGFPKTIQTCRRILIYLLALLLIGITLVASISLDSIQSEKPVLVSILISVVITVINFLIEFLIIIVSTFQRQFQKSKEEASIGIKIAVSQIINCIGVPIALVFLGKQSIYSSGGLVTNVFILGLINMLLPIGRFIDPFNIVLLIRQRYYWSPQRRLLKLSGQAELNKIFSFYQFQLGYQYAYLIKTAFFTGFYLTLQPIIALFAPIGLILMFLCNKYRLLYRFNKPNFHSSSVNNMLNFFLKSAIIAFSLGQLYFMNFNSYTASFVLIINWVTLGVSVVFVVFPLRYCQRFFQESSSPALDYNEQVLYLTTDYDRLNPVTKQKAIDEFRQFLQQYQKKCHLPLPQKSQIIRRSMIQLSKHVPTSIINFMRQKTKIHLKPPSEIYTNDRIRS